MRIRAKQAALFGSTALLALLCAAAASAQTKTFDIPSEDAGKSIPELARQAGIQIVAPGQRLHGVVTPAVKGTYDTHAALQTLLAGTDVSIASDDGQTIILSVPPKNAEAASNSGAALSTETVVVTGTSIRGGANPTLPVTIYDRETIERSGYGTTQDFIQSLPDNFKGGSSGASEDGLLGNGSLAGSNFESASGVNLRGLGTNSTLVLVNGHRLAASILGSAVDISQIPLGAIDRVEVLPDGASAIYGSDAVGGVVNFVLRKDYEGAETTAYFSDVTSGDRPLTSVNQTFGHSWDGGGLLAAVGYQGAGSLLTTERPFTSQVPTPSDIVPATTQYSALLSAHQQIAEDVDVAADFMYNRKNVNDVFSGTFQTQRNISGNDFINADVTVGWEPVATWRVEATGLFSQQRVQVRNFSTPELDGYTNGAPYLRNNTSIAEGDVKADGTLFALPGGDVKAAVGGSFRAEDFSSLLQYVPLDREFHRHVASVFGELLIPVVGEQNEIPFVHRFDISAAVRYDHYSDFGGATNPKIGAAWSPVSDVTLRTSWGTSFRAPNPGEEEVAAGGLNVLAFPPLFSIPSGDSEPILLLTGSERNLLPESSRSVTAGIDYAPTFIPGAKFSLSYYDIGYHNRITNAPFATDALLHPNIYGPLITQFSNDAAAAAFVDNLVSKGAFYFDLTPGGTGTTGIRYAYEIAQTNAAIVHQNGFDIDASYNTSIGANSLHFDIDTAIVNEIQTNFCNSCASTNLVNTFGEPLQVRLRATAGWAMGEWSANTALNYSNSYSDTTLVPAGSVGSYVTFDVNVGYRPEWLPGTTVTLAATNLFDEDAPRTGLSSGLANYDVANANPFGRVLAIQLREQW
jgi:outer membrane receptor protein involved in Fe transport